MTPFTQMPNRITSLSKIPPHRREGYVEYKTEQQSNKNQHAQVSVPCENADIAAQVHLGYRRCVEFDEGNHPGQDYAVVRLGDGYLVGVVADGVSQSFYGNLAAKYLADWLVNELWQRRTAGPDEQSMDSLLKNSEAKFAKTVEEHSIPTDLPATLRIGLERKRPKGSQTVFAAIVLDVASGGLTLYQVGDVKAVIHNSNPEPELVEAPGKGRWSSAGQSLLLLKRTFSANVNGFVIKSDGVSEDWGRVLDAVFDADEFSQMSETCSPLDDVSFIAVRRYQVDGPAALLPAAPKELMTNNSRNAESNGTVPSYQSPQQPENSDFGPSETLDTTDVAVVVGEKEDVSGTATQGQRSTPAKVRRQRRNLKVFMAGVAAGATLMYLIIFATSRLKMRAVDGKQVAGQTNLDPLPDKRSTAAPDSDNVTVKVKETKQIDFQQKHSSSFPSLIRDNPTTLKGEIIAHVSVKGISIGGVELALDEQQSALVERALQDVDHSSFFVRLSGLGELETVTIRLIDLKGNVISQFHEKMRGREVRSRTNKDPFLGYHEISITRTQ